MAAMQRFLRFILPARALEAVRQGTKLWLAECPCGYKRDLWDSGGVRYKAAGNPLSLSYCPECDRNRMFLIRKKTEEEKQELP